jgi:propionyl-CoA carboxylase alpha chain
MNRLLIANRGEIARRIIRTGHALGITTAVVFSDADANEPFVHEADEAYHLTGNTPAETYLNRDAVLEAARALSADAIHPGYGFLSEDALFARMCREAGVTFVGPPPSAIDAMGSKLNARRIMADAGVPMLLAIEVSATDPGDVAGAAAALGTPILVKASHGGGGRGMRIVESPNQLADAILGATREAERAFGSGIVYLERYLSPARHIEVQIVADQHGHVTHVFDRDCSVQRRHQKVIEEAPSYVMPPAKREGLLAAAVGAAAAVGYVGAGTVEFLVDDTGDYFFLEMNTRLQVEHPVTEEITGLDLVAAQLMIAAGATLEEAGLTDLATRGHAIEARLYAEDVRRSFAPTSGPVRRIVYPAGPGIRVDAGVETGSEVSTHYDAMIAKIVAHAHSRPLAIQRLRRALQSMRIDGLTTNKSLLIGILDSPTFQSGDLHTGWLDTADPTELVPDNSASDRLRRHAAVAALAGQAARRQRSPFPRLPSGWRNNYSQPQSVDFATGDDVRLHVEYQFDRDELTLSVQGVKLGSCRLWSCTPQAVDLEVDGVRRRYVLDNEVDAVAVHSGLGDDHFMSLSRFPTATAGDEAGSLLAPTPGTVIDVMVSEGQLVTAGEAIVTLESMKMEHRIYAPHAGIVSDIRVTAGEQVTAGTLIAVLHGADE